MRSLLYAAIWTLWVYDGRMVAAQMDADVGGVDEQAGTDGGTGTDGTAVAAQKCECVDSSTWVHPTHGGGCATYRMGGVNEGYCESDQAYTPCKSACDSCPECSSSAVALDSTMLWIGIPCILLGLCAPVLKTVLFYLNDDRKTVVQQEQEQRAQNAADRPRTLTMAEQRLEELERQQREPDQRAQLDLVRDDEQQAEIHQLQQKVDALSPVQRSA